MKDPTGYWVFEASPQDHKARNAELATIRATLEAEFGPGVLLPNLDDSLLYMDWVWRRRPAAKA